MSVIAIERRPAPRIDLSRFRTPAVQLASLAAGALIWQIAGVLLRIEWLPPLSTVLAKWASLWAQGILEPELAASLLNLVIGYAFSVVVGVSIGSLMAFFPKVDYALNGYVYGLLLAPSIVLAPVLFLVFGLSPLTPISVIVVYATVFIIVNTYTAMKGVSRPLQEMAYSFGATSWQRFWLVTLPDAAPLLFAGLRLGLGRAVKGMINGELIITLIGLGALDEQFDGSFDVPGILSIAITVIAVAIVVSGLLQLVDRWVNGWLYAQEEQLHAG